MKLIVAMSGGVDSSVAAAMMVDAGHDVSGVTMKLWGGESDNGCCAVSDTDDARRVAHRLGIEHHVFNFGEEFDRHVVEPYVAAHRAGETPNPCVECNRHIKFDKLIRRSRALGFDAVVTGHHVRRVQDDAGRWRLARAVDVAKDQSYVLNMLSPSDLGDVWFPVGEMTKDDVRRIATERGLATADKPDSQDVCFITKSAGRQNFLSGRIDLHPGIVVDESGATVGSTEAIELVTIGQRRGLDLAGGDARRFVTDVDVSAGRVSVGPPERLLVDQTLVGSMAWAIDPAELDTLDLTVQVSAHGVAATARIDVSTGHDGTDRVTVNWLEPHRRVAVGQSVVVYADELVVAGGLAIRAG